MFLNIHKQTMRLFAILSMLVSSAVLADYPALPEPVANNAVAHVRTADGEFLLSFMGLGPGKTWRDVHDKAWRLKLGERHWQPIAPVPSSLTLKGRLAGVAVALGDKAYLFGGYTVAEDHSEISSPDNFSYDPVNNRYEPIARTPVPVDDAVALVYQDRYIYLISGWHNDGNVNLVQVYDAKNDTWFQASPFLGKPVFGHAGGIVDNTMVVCDGVKVVARKEARRTFKPEAACFIGTIDKEQPGKVDWRTLGHPTNVARYRMAATGSKDSIVFFGGSDNPYNYNGVGYNGVPSEPDDKAWIYDIASATWQISKKPLKTMDHRGLVAVDDEFIVIGGMEAGQAVSSKVSSFR